MRKALGALAAYGNDYPARYRLLLSDLNIAAQGGDLEAAALKSSTEFARIVGELQQSRALPQISLTRLPA